MKQKPRLLFITFYFPPMHSVATVRTVNIAKFLKRLGWDVSVVTPHPSLWQHTDDPQRVATELDDSGIQRIYTGHRLRFLSSGHLKRTGNHDVEWFLGALARRIARFIGIDEMIGWYPEVERACAKLKMGDIDIVLATGGPFGAFRVAQRIAKHLRCPYVLDYRDLWSDNPHSQDASQKHSDRERCILKDCAAVSAISPSMAKSLGERFQHLSKKIHVIPNGYSLEDFMDIVPTAFGHFAIVYAGQFLPPKRTAEPLMKALDRLAGRDAPCQWRFHYYGPQSDHVHDCARKHRVEQYVDLHGVVSRREALSAIAGAGVAAVVIADNDSANLADRGIITGKIFEAIGLGTPVIVIAPLQSDVENVVHTVGKAALFTGSDINGMATFIAELMQGKIPSSKNPQAYAWPQLIQKMDIMLREAILSYK